MVAVVGSGVAGNGILVAGSIDAEGDVFRAVTIAAKMTVGPFSPGLVFDSAISWIRISLFSSSVPDLRSSVFDP
jgi:hypothetical protein